MRLAAVLLVCLAACQPPVDAPIGIASQAAGGDGVPTGEGAPGIPMRSQAAFCTDDPRVLEAMAAWSKALPPYVYNYTPMPALRAFCGVESIPVWLDPGLHARTRYYGWFQAPTSITRNGAIILDPTYLTVGLAMHEIGHALGLGHLGTGVMRSHELDERACIDDDTAALFPGAHATCD